MAKQSFNIPTDAEGNEISLETEIAAGGAGVFGIIRPANYTAVVESVEEDFFHTSSGKILWKMTPHYRVLRPEGRYTIINRQDAVIGYVKDEESRELYSTNPNYFPIWSKGGARFLLQALGQFSQEGDQVVFDANVRHIANRVINVRTAIAVYTKNRDVANVLRNADGKERLNVLEPDGFNKYANNVIEMVTGGARKQWAWSDDNEDLTAVIRELNSEYGVDGDEGFRTKNVVVYTSPVTELVIEDNEFFVDEETNAVYLTEADYIAYRKAVEATEEAGDQASGEGW